MLTNPKAPAGARNVLRALQRATASLPTALIIVEAGAPAAIEPAFARMQERHAGALLVLGDGLFTSERRQIIALAASHRLPAIYHDRIFVE